MTDEETGSPTGTEALDAETLEPDDIDELLAELAFDADSSVLTRRQAEVLVLREQGYRQVEIADLLETSRANVASVEGSARENVSKARETVAFAEALTAPVSVEIPAGTDLYDVPEQVFRTCDEAGVKVRHTGPELMKVISDGVTDAIQNRRVRNRLLITVTNDGSVRARTP